PPPPPEEKPPEPEETNDKAQAAEEKPKAEAQQSESSKIPDQPGGKLNEAQAAALSNELEQLSMMTLGALGAAGPATAGVLQGGEVPTGALDAAAPSGAGVGVGGDLKLGGRGGPVQPGASQGLGSIGSTGKGNSGSGSVAEVKGPVGNASVSSSVAVGSVSNAASVVAAMRAGFRRCYQRGLEQNPDISGSIRLSISVGPGGEVSNVGGGPTGNIPGSVVDCVKGRARAAQFAPPDGGSAVINVPISFVKQ
ncbi:MAG TPA: AgmX/PglI C-terminal domain-containing protein, partial [Polyangiaceae bacterium]|nr:AgmX/PglI C-terminal domain-containing protein [Polyangiaceae bacterium]